MSGAHLLFCGKLPTDSRARKELYPLRCTDMTVYLEEGPYEC